MRRLTMVAMVLGGCASASVDNPGNPGDDSGMPGTEDASTDGTVPIDAAIDAVPIDAPITVTLNQNQANNIVAAQIGCQRDGYTRENSYYRVFSLADQAITTSFHLTQVTFGVELASSPSGSVPAEVRIGTFSGALNQASFTTSQLAQMAVASIEIPNGTNNVVTPITSFSPPSVTIPAGSNVYAEIYIPDGYGPGRRFYMGSNNGGETRPSYIRAPLCNSVNPTTYAAIGYPQIQLLINITGTH